MKKFFLLTLFIFWTINVALPSWMGDKPIKICKADQDIKVSMN